MKFLKKGLVTFVLASTLIGLTGCNTTTKNDLRNDVNNDLTTRNVRNNMDNRLNVQNVRDNNNLRVSNRAGRSVEKLKEVDLAHVIIRDNDAYVAVRLQNNRNQTGTTGTTGTTNITGTNTTRNNLATNNYNSTSYNSLGTAKHGNYPNNTGVTGVDNTGTGIGNNVNAGQGVNTRGTVDIRGTGTGSTVDNSGFTGTNNGTTGTYDGTTRSNYHHVSSALDKKIQKQVHVAEKSINRVYISYDRTFFNQMTNYSNDLSTGRNKNGVWNDFTNSVNNIFR